MINLLELFNNFICDMDDSMDYLFNGNIYDEDQEKLDNSPIEIDMIDTENCGYDEGSEEFLSIFKVTHKETGVSCLIGQGWWSSSYVGNELNGSPYLVEAYEHTETRYRSIT